MEYMSFVSESLLACVTLTQVFHMNIDTDEEKIKIFDRKVDSEKVS